MTEELPSFVTPLSSGLEPTGDPVRLSPEVEQEVRRRLDELARHRAQALISGRDYLIL